MLVPFEAPWTHLSGPYIAPNSDRLLDSLEFRRLLCSFMIRLIDLWYFVRKVEPSFPGLNSCFQTHRNAQDFLQKFKKHCRDICYILDTFAPFLVPRWLSYFKLTILCVFSMLSELLECLGGPSSFFAIDSNKGVFRRVILLLTSCMVVASSHIYY